MKHEFECRMIPGINRHAWYRTDLLESHHRIVEVYGEEYNSYHYRIGTRLTVTITIDEPDQPAALDDDTAGKLNTFMNGGL